MTALILNLFHFIAVGCNGEYTVVAMNSTVDAVEDQTVIIHVGDHVLMVVSINTAHQSGEEIQIAAEGLAHIVIELVAIGWCMHHDDGSVELVSILRHLLLHVVEVGHGSQIGVFGGIGVKTQELHSSGDEREIHLPIHDLVGLVTSAEEIVVADQSHERITQTLQDIAAPCWQTVSQ